MTTGKRLPRFIEWMEGLQGCDSLHSWFTLAMVHATSCDGCASEYLQQWPT